MTDSLVGRLGINQGTSFVSCILAYYPKFTARFGHRLSTGAIHYAQSVDNGEQNCDSRFTRLFARVKMLAISAKAFKACAINSASSFIILYINIYSDWVSFFYVCAKLEKTA
jgi:hypothetical protein